MEGKIGEVPQNVEQKVENWERKEDWRIGLGSPVCESLEVQKKQKCPRKKSRLPRTEALEFLD